MRSWRSASSLASSRSSGAGTVTARVPGAAGLAPPFFGASDVLVPVPSGMESTLCHGGCGLLNRALGACMTRGEKDRRGLLPSFRTSTDLLFETEEALPRRSVRPHGFDSRRVGPQARSDRDRLGDLPAGPRPAVVNLGHREASE